MSTSSGDRIWLTTSAVFCSAISETDAGLLMRKAVGALLASGNLDFEEDEDRESFYKPAENTPIWTDGPVFLFDKVSSSAVLVRHYWQPNEAYHYVVISPDSTVIRSELETEWMSLVQLAEAIITAINPDLFFGWARLPDDNSDPFDYRALCGVLFPPVILPWNYFGRRFLNQGIRKHFEGLPAHAVKSISEGLLIQPVLAPGISPSASFRSEIASLENIDYVDPLLVGA